MRSVRFRLTVWYAVLLLGALALFSGAIWLSLRSRLLYDQDREIAAAAERFRVYFLRETATHAPEQITDELEEYCQALPPSTYLDLQGSNGYQFQFPPKGRRRPSHTRSTNMRFSSGGSNYALGVGASSREIFHALELLEALLLSLIPVVVAIASVGGAWMSRRALRPVDEITTAADRIGIANLAERLPVPPTGDELERLTRVWNGMLERLDTAVKTLSQFAADASHELRTPLAIIRTGAELSLRRERDPEAYRESLAEIAAEAERMTQLVEDLLFLARAEARNTGMPMEPLALEELLRDVVSEVRGLAEEAGISLQLHVEPAVVSGNRAALRRLLLALLDNAIKYSPQRSEVRVRLRVRGETAVIEVSDRGIGIATEDLPQIFQRFYRADKARSSGGHGLGLSLASTIAIAHNGTLQAESREGEGSTFRLTLQGMLSS